MACTNIDLSAGSPSVNGSPPTVLGGLDVRGGSAGVPRALAGWAPSGGVQPEEQPEVASSRSRAKREVEAQEKRVTRYMRKIGECS